MADCCNCHNEVSRDGSGQLGRFLKALDPSYALIDDRSIEDLLVFTKRYANQIRFYDIPGSNGDNENDTSKISWREFFRRDMAVIAASISLTDTAQIKKDYDELRANLDAQPSHNTFDDLFDPILGMVTKLDGWYSIAIPANPLYADLQLAINSNLKWQAQQIVAYEKGFNYVDASHPLNLDYSSIKNKNIWGLNENINADISIYQGTDTEDKLRNGALYIDDIFNSFYNFLNQLLTSSESYMQFALKKYPAHQPHMALFIAFLQLFHLAQRQMNGITKRMLNFYYRDILHLAAKSSIPDKVHIVFELAKDVADYDVATGTQLNAGKDNSGKDQIYTTETDLVVNQAKVKEIKNIFIDKTSSTLTDASGNTSTKQIINRIYARPVAKSSDGLGEKFPDPTNTKWPTFGRGNALSTSNNLCDKILSADDTDRKDIAQIGFAFASPQLVLQGGKRLIKVGMNTGALTDEQKQQLSEFLAAIEVWLTGEKGWVKVLATADTTLKQTQSDFITTAKTGVFDDDIKIENKSFYSMDTEDNTLCIYLPMSEQAVISFDAKLHTGYDFKTSYPVMVIVSSAQSNINIDEELYKQLTISGLTIRTKVGSVNPQPTATGGTSLELHLDGLKKLVLQNKDGLIDPGKPFDPFTAYPLPGRSFYIGSDEIFNKPFVESNNDQLAINIKKTIDDQTGSSQTTIFRMRRFNWEAYNVSILERKNWMPIEDTSNQPISFTLPLLTSNILNSSVLPANRTPISTVTEWKSDTAKGFIKIDLTEKPPDQNPEIFLAAAVSTTAADILQVSQNLAPGLEIKEISVSYDSTVTIEMGVDQFFHIYPFGAVETYLSSAFRKNNNVNAEFADLDNLKKGLLVNAGNALLPQFNFLSPYSKYYNNVSSAAKIINRGDILRIKYNRVGFANSRSSTAVDLIQNAKDDAANNINQYDIDGDMQQGILDIGIENLQPLQSISMLLQFAEGSAEDEDDDPPTINWSYLTNNQWRPFKAANIVSDGTYGFQTTGIIKIDIPEDATTNNTIATTGLIWLRASVKENANRIPQLIDIVTQAVEAQFVDNDNDQSHFDNALPATSISKLVTPVAQIGTVQQPFASFDGKHREIGKEFYTRVSERLRHKGRAINAWDYEHLVLDRFPSIYKVKCITHADPNCLCTNKSLTVVNSVLPVVVNFTGANASMANTLNSVAVEINANPLINITLIGYGLNGADHIKTIVNAYATGNLIINGTNTNEIITKVDLRRINSKTADSENNGNDNTVNIIQTENCCGPQIAPGHVLLIPIANLKNRNAANPLQPKTSRRTLIAIQEYLKTKTSPFVHVHAKNPVYEQIIVQFKVQFYPGIDKGYYIKKLNDEIVHYLTPWAFDENAEVKFNQKIYASSIINFIEERDYVDFITDFVMGVCCNECCTAEDPAGVGTISGRIFDSMQKPLEGIKIKIKELNKIVTSALPVNANDPNDSRKGTYKIENIPPGTYTLLAYFSIFNIAKQSFTINETGVADPLTIDFNEGAGNRQSDIETFFSDFCGCDEIVKFLQNDPNFDGDIVAKPCTSRSILVSVPQHIIIPFEEDEEPTPCEKRKAEQQAGNTTTGGVLTGTRDTIPTAPTPAPTRPVIKRASEKITTVKKANETAPVKSATSASIKKIKTAATRQPLKPKKPK
jgi:hypothetical protein